MENNNEEVSENLLLTIYQTTRNNQEFYMKQRWAAVYYVLISYAALFAVYAKLGGSKEYIIPLGVLVAACGTTILCLLCCSMCETKKTTQEVESKLPCIKRLISFERKKAFKVDKSLIVTFIFFALIVISCLFFMHLINNYQPSKHNCTINNCQKTFPVHRSS